MGEGDPRARWTRAACFFTWGDPALWELDSEPGGLGLEEEAGWGAVHAVSPSPRSAALRALGPAACYSWLMTEAREVRGGQPGVQSATPAMLAPGDRGRGVE